jgi:hypothetical protein
VDGPNCFGCAHLRRTSSRCQRSSVCGVTISPLPASRREDSGKRRKEGAIGCSKRWPWLLPTEHRKLLPQNKQFGVLGELVAPASDKQPQHSREREISEREEHPPMLPEPATAVVESRNLDF